MTEGFKKNDRTDAKPRVELVDPDFTEGVARVLMYGAEKYGEDNWKNAVEDTFANRRRFAAAIIRHAHAILRGDLYDDETYLDHALHIGCEAMFIAYLNRYYEWELRVKHEDYAISLDELKEELGLDDYDDDDEIPQWVLDQADSFETAGDR